MHVPAAGKRAATPPLSYGHITIIFFVLIICLHNILYIDYTNRIRF